MVAPLEQLCIFGVASQADDAGSALIYKLLGRGDNKETYELVLEATDVLSSYISKFSLQDVIDSVEADAGVVPSGEMALAWLKQRFDGEMQEASITDSGLQLSAAHTTADGNYDLMLRLPPASLRVPRLADQRRATWVAQDVLFTQAERLRVLQRQLEECEQRCSTAQQWEDAVAFLAGGADGAASPALPRAAQHKRKQAEVAPVSASAVKKPRPDGMAAAAARAAAGAAAQPASTQQTGGMSNNTQRTTVSITQKVVQGGGRGRGRGGPVQPKRPGKKR